MKKVLLIIDVQKSAVTKPEIAKKIEKLQYEYDVVYVSKFTNKGSPLLEIMDWEGYADETLVLSREKMRLFLKKQGIVRFCPR